MSKKKVPSNTNIGNISKEKLSDTTSSNLMANTSENIKNTSENIKNTSGNIKNPYGDVKNPYPPNMRTDYFPSDESVESATGVDFPINMPNPAVDPIVANNIAYREFDYTED